MCGIVGQFNKSDEPVRETKIKQMCSTIMHRGPDDEGVFVNDNVGIGMRRLNIIDLNTGHQPIYNEDKSCWIVFNGEIYNYLELRKYLIDKGHKFYTQSDTEVILHLYEQEGTECLQKLNGMFAFAIYDKNKSQLFIARDRLGIKPLFYCETNSKFLFASEMKAILAHRDISRGINWRAFDAYFTLSYIPAPMTIYGNIFKLPPAHFMIIKKGERVRINKYWHLNRHVNSQLNEKEFIEKFLQIFEESVKSQLVSDVPLGAFLSGGVDSSSVVAMMAKQNSNIQTLSIGFGGNIGAYDDERKYARMVSEKFGSTHHEYEVLSSHCNSEVVREIVRAFDEPFADHGAIPNYFVCKLAKKNMTVALSGLGGDELFGGYPRHMGIHLSRIYSLLPGLLKNNIFPKMIDKMPESSGGEVTVNWMKRFIRSGGLPPAKRYFNYFNLLSKYNKYDLFSPDVLEELQSISYFDEFNEYFGDDDKGDLLSRACYTDLHVYMPEDILCLTDRISMMHSLEVRVPFLDHNLVEFCASIPSKFKISGRTQKYLLRKAIGPILPPEVLNHKKQGFVAPMNVWIVNELKEYVQNILMDTASHDGFFNKETIARILKEHYSGEHLNTALIWSLLMFKTWQEEYLN